MLNVVSKAFGDCESSNIEGQLLAAGDSLELRLNLVIKSFCVLNE
jgi:hypothetical protein